jgi:DNA-binding NtrC family response regulator
MRPETHRGAAAIVATADSRWAATVEDALRARGLEVARFDEVRYAGLAAVSGDIATVWIDTRLVGPSQVTQIAQWRAAAPALKVILVGESRAAAEICRALESGGTAYLPWPFDGDCLARILGQP